MNDQHISIYSEEYVYFGGDIIDGKLSLVSEVYGDDFDSEKYYELSQQETTKLFEIISIDELVKMCREEHVAGLEEFLRKHHISYQCTTM